MSAGAVLVRAERLTRFCSDVFASLGLSRADADIGASVLVRSDMRGVYSHGTWFFPKYVRQLQHGGVDPATGPEVVHEVGGTVLLDGRAGLGLAIGHKATELAVAKARAHGIGMVSVRNSNHFGAAGIYALNCAEQGVIGIVTSNGSRNMKVTGSKGKVLCNSPFAYGVPTGDVPVVLDVAMSATAGSKVRLAAVRGESLPDGYIVDRDGYPSNDPEAYLAGGSLVPIGDHKGYGLALMTEILAAALSGAAMAGAVGSWMGSPERSTGTGHVFIAIDVEAVTPVGDFLDRMRRLRDEVRGAELGPGAERIYIPGELEHEREQRAASEGLRLEGAIWSGLEAVAAELSVSDALEAAVISGRAGANA